MLLKQRSSWPLSMWWMRFLMTSFKNKYTMIKLRACFFLRLSKRLKLVHLTWIFFCISLLIHGSRVTKTEQTDGEDEDTDNWFHGFLYLKQKKVVVLLLTHITIKRFNTPNYSVVLTPTFLSEWSNILHFLINTAPSAGATLWLVRIQFCLKINRMIRWCLWIHINIKEKSWKYFVIPHFYNDQ